MCPGALAGLLALSQLATAYLLDVGSSASLKHTASYMAEDMMAFYNGHQSGGTPGLLPQPYYWWEAGALMGALVDYWYYTGDTRWNDVAQQGLLFQVGPNNDYMPLNQTVTEGNDDQGFWGMAVMSAAEYNFQNPPKDSPQWLSLAQAVFNTQAARWDAQDCGGGLRWQIFTWNKGYDYKNSISQACFFNLAARLARYTGNQSYAVWADKTWDWMVSSQLLDTNRYYVYDGMHTANCSDIIRYQWTYNAGAFLLGAAAMYNFTTGAEQEVWRSRVDGLLSGIQVFFRGLGSNIMTEVACEPVNFCDLDQQSFKAYLARWMAATTKWAPWTYTKIKPVLESSAVAAASTCIGGNNRRMCGLKWTTPNWWDGTIGMGQQMAAMEVVLGNLIQQVAPPVTDGNGGTSTGDPGAGGSDVGRTDPFSIVDSWPPIKTGDKAGAWICTIVIVAGVILGCSFMLVDEKSGQEAWQKISTNLRPDVLGCGCGGAGCFSRHKGREKQAKMLRRFTGDVDDDMLEEKDVVVEFHHDTPAEDLSWGRGRRSRRHQSAQFTASSYWDGDGSVGRVSQPRTMNREHRLSYPGANRGNSLRKTAIQNRVHWRDSNQYI